MAEAAQSMPETIDTVAEFLAWENQIQDRVAGLNVILFLAELIRRPATP